jgi:hypothetical protein
MTQTGEENRRGMIRIRPYGAGLGQFDSAYKVGEGILFKAEIAFNFAHFIVQKPRRLEIQLAERKKPVKCCPKLCSTRVRQFVERTIIILLKPGSKIKSLVLKPILCF